MAGNVIAIVGSIILLSLAICALWGANDREVR